MSVSISPIYLLYQIECLLKLGQVGEALARADTVQQPKLIHMVLRHLTRTLSKSQLELEVRKIPHVSSTVIH